MEVRMGMGSLIKFTKIRGKEIAVKLEERKKERMKERKKEIKNIVLRRRLLAHQN